MILVINGCINVGSKVIIDVPIDEMLTIDVPLHARIVDIICVVLVVLVLVVLVSLIVNNKV